MDEQIEMLGRALLINLAVAFVVVSAMLIYVCYLLLRLHREVRHYLRPPEVERDGSGRRIRERV
jgi:cell division protein FtsL